VPDLTGLPVLDVAIGMAFLFFLLASLCSGIQEAIASIFNLRAKTLEKGLRNLLNDPEAAGKDVKDFAAQIYEHPLVRPLWRDGEARLHEKKRITGKPKKLKRRLPSYLPPRTFAQALFDVVAPDVDTVDAQGQPRPSHSVLDDVIAKLDPIGKEKDDLLIPDDLRAALLTIANQARGDIEEFRKGIEDWFDDAMARVSGWYKRKAQWILAGIALAVTMGLNVDSGLITQRLWNDEAVRTAVVNQATRATKADQVPAVDLKKTADDVESVKQLGLPLGWPPPESKHAKQKRTAQKAAGKNIRKDPRAFSPRKIPGWLVTWLALLLGGPFWFDLVKRLVQLRGTGPPENTGVSKPSANSRRSRSTP
jgi:hypothetical protein